MYKRKLWNVDGYSFENVTPGLFLHFEKDVNKEVKRACICLTRWLRREYEFPKRIDIYYDNSTSVTSMTGEKCCSLIHLPEYLDEEVYAIIATGDYESLLKEKGKDNALAPQLASTLRILSFYFQWLKDEPDDKRKAYYFAREILYDYAETRDHP